MDINLDTPLNTTGELGHGIPTSVREILEADPAASRAAIGAAAEGDAGGPPPDLGELATMDVADLTALGYKTETELALGDLAKKNEVDLNLTSYALASDLANYALASDLGNYALTTDLANYATTASLADYALTASLGELAMMSEADLGLGDLAKMNQADLGLGPLATASVVANENLAGGFNMVAFVPGGIVGAFAVPGIKVGDILSAVVFFAGAGVAVTNVALLTSEFTISADAITSTVTDTTGGVLMVFWTKITV